VPTGLDVDVVAFRTATGSAYEVNLRQMTWRRAPTMRSGVLRSEAGSLWLVRSLKVGEPAILFCPPFRPGGPLRAIITSPVVAIGSESAESTH
jgi:hypothetical protein